MIVQVRQGPGGVELSEPVPIFKADDAVSGDASADGPRLLLAVRPGGRGELSVRLVQNRPAAPP